MIKIGKYRHYKTGNIYKVHFIAKHSETLEDMVIYEALYDNKMSKFWARPASMWVEIVKNKEGKEVPRFKFVE
jgi:hypothetical protein